MTEPDWRSAVLLRMDNLEKRMVKVETKSAVDEVHRENVEQRLGEIEDTLKWLVRLILGALVLAVVAFALGGNLIISAP